MWVYVRSKHERLWTVGFYAPDGEWHPESDHHSEETAAERVHYLNGGSAVRADELEQLRAERDLLKQERASWVCLLRGVREELVLAVDIEGDDESPITERLRAAIDDLTRLIGDGTVQEAGA